MKKWIDLPGYVMLVPGTIGFLAERFDINRNLTVYWDVRPDPIRTIGVARRPLLTGGAGAYNDMVWIAHGLCRVIRTNLAETRAYIEPIDPGSPEGRAFLQSAGFPQFIPEGVSTHV